MKQTILILLLLICNERSLFARRISVHPRADKLYSDSAYTALIKKYSRTALVDRGVGSTLFEINYSGIEDSVIRATVIESAKRVEQLDKNRMFSTGNETRFRQQLENELARIVRSVLATRGDLRNKMLREDKNDRILEFGSRVQMLKDGSMEISELIRIANFKGGAGVNDEIQRGITRDFPTRYINAAGLIHTVPFTLLSIERNGKRETHHIEKLSNGVRIYCGEKSFYLEEGIHEYRIRYRTARQLILHDNKEECYWNVTGNGWHFTIDRAWCILDFPGGSNIVEHACYTGTQGNTKQHCSYELRNEESIKFFSNTRLQAGEGLTVAAAVQRGVFNRPERLQMFKALVSDNAFLFILLACILFLFLFLLRLWYRVGRDPEPGIIVPEFEPPPGLSPPETGFIDQEGYHHRHLGAALVDLAIQKKIHIEVGRSGSFFKRNYYAFSSMEKGANENTTHIPDEYQDYGFRAEDLFGMRLEQGVYNPAFKSISTRFQEHLESKILSGKQKKHSKGLLAMNTGIIGLGILFLFLLIIGSVIYMGISKPPLPTILYAIGLLVTGIIIQTVFMRIIKSFTPEGRMVADKVAGFKMYLSNTEQHRFDLMNPPNENLQLYERYLPYAIAMNVENKWSEKFKNVIEQAMAEGYSPSYYHFHSSSSHHSFQSFASGMGSSLAGTISSSSTPPSSGSGGSSGGGSSGGGGGGGGGGGW